MPRKTRTDNANATTTPDPDTTAKRSLESLAVSLERAEDIALGRQTKYNAIKGELDKLTADCPQRAQIAQVFDRAVASYVKLTEASEAYRKALTAHDERAKEIAAEIAPDLDETPAEIAADVVPNGVPVVTAA